MSLELKIGDLKLRRSSNDDEYEITAPVDKDSTYVIAFVQLNREECNLRTVGNRPWEIENISSDEFFKFAKLAMDLLNKVYKEDNQW